MIVLSVHSMLLQNLIKAAGDGTFAISEAVVNLCSFLLTLNNQDIIRTFEGHPFQGHQARAPTKVIYCRRIT
tara:strand:+ start:347 stop:562 length:216 start_codon:yes stop_codon:yes gene_type:complete